MKAIFGQEKSLKYNESNHFFLDNVSTSSIFEYRKKTKHMNAVLLSVSLLGIALAVLLFYFFPFEMDRKNNYLGDIFHTILSAIQEKTYIGLSLTSLFGGLFFLIFPLELYFFASLSEFPNPWFSFSFYYLGILAAQSLNYWFGLRASRFCKVLIPPKKFYKLKGSLNRWGIWMIFFMNCLPLPSPILSTVLGAFKYSFRRFFLVMALGSFLLYSGMIVIYLAFENTGEEELSWIKY
jgi:membrane protein YqaA with SNARE-associated domain